MTREHADRAITADDHRVERILASALLHPWRADRHARHGKAKRLRAIAEQFAYVRGRDMPFDEKAVDFGRVASAQIFGHLELGRHVRNQFGFENLHGQRSGFHLIDPCRTAAAVR